MIVIGGTFILGVAILSLISSFIFPGKFLPMLVLDGMALLGAYYFYLLWDKRPIRLRCRSCRKVVLSNTPWICTCSHKNINATEFPFVYKCEICGNEPKAYQCHHENCGEIIFLSEDEDTANYVTSIHFLGDISNQRKRTRTLQKRQETKQDQEHRIDVTRSKIIKAQLDERLNLIKNRSEKAEPKSKLESKQKDLKEFFDSRMAVEKAAQLQKQHNAENCKGDNRQRRRDDLVVDEWVQNQKAGEE